MRDIPKTMHTTNTSELIRQIPWSDARAAEPEVLLTREWLVTNGLGGYAAGTVSGIPTRRYHGFLVAALPAPFGRMMLLPQLSEQLRLPDGTIVRLGGEGAGAVRSAYLALRRTSAKPVLAPSVRYSMPKSRLHPMAASRRPGAWPKCCGAG